MYGYSCYAMRGMRIFLVILINKASTIGIGTYLEHPVPTVKQISPFDCFRRFVSEIHYPVFR